MTTTIGIFTSHSEAESAINELKAFGVSEGDLSYVYKNSLQNILNIVEIKKPPNVVAFGGI